MTSNKIKSLLAMVGKKQRDLCDCLGMSTASLSNKMKRDTWTAKDLAKIAAFCGCKVGFVLPDGERIFIDTE